jgi:threonine dehydratase
VIGIADIEAAAERLAGVAVRTPLLRNAELDRIADGNVLIKPECFQSIGSFKIRGAYNLLSQLSTEQAKRGVVAWSSGNHAQGVALAGQLLGIHAAIVMPEDAPKAKLENTRRLGGEIITYDRHRGDREAIAREIAAERGAEIVPSYDDQRIVAGQGTVGMEIADQSVQLGLPVDQVLINCGGGGLAAGCVIALRSRLPDAVIYTVEPEDFDDTARSLACGERVGIRENAHTICDALRADMPGQLTFDIMTEFVTGGLTVSDVQVREAMRFAFVNLKIVVEPGGAVALAAVLSGKIDTAGKTTAIIFSGGNVDVEQFASIQTERT